MMVETILESSQDFAMSNGTLPQWKRELLQRRAARSRPAPPPAPPAPPLPPPPTEEEELRYGPGIVKRLKSRYLSLALRDAPRRRPSVLRRAASLEHLLDEPPVPRPRPVSLAVPPAPPRRDSVKRARSVDALSRLDEPDAAPRCRPPRRPAPLLRDTERPPPDVVRAALRKFETAPARRTAPAARVSAVLRGLENGPRSSTPEPRARSPSPAAADLSIIDEPECAVLASKPVSRAALDGIARAGSTVRYSFESPKNGSHLPTVAASNPVLLGRARLWTSPRRVGVIRPMPAPTPERDDTSSTPPPELLTEKSTEDSRVVSPQHEPEPRPEKREPPSAAVEPIPRSPSAENTVMEIVRASSPRPIPFIRERTPEPTDIKSEPRVMETMPKHTLMNGHAEPARAPEPKARTPSRIGAAGIERAWTGAKAKKIVEIEEKKEPEVKPAPWVRKPRPPAPTSTSVVFNFSNRKEVPDYIENDGIILRSSRRNRIKAGEPGVVVLRPEAVARDSGSESEAEAERPPSPCSVRFVNDNVLINGRSSMCAHARADRHRIAKLKLQFDDSLTRTFEYPSETSLCKDSPADAPAATAAPSSAASPPPAPAAASATLAANTHLASGSLGRYTPSKTTADDFQLGLTRPRVETETEQNNAVAEATTPAAGGAGVDADTEAEAGAGDARPCAADLARSWSDARALSTDLLF